MSPWMALVACCALGAPGETVLLDFYADWCGPCRAMQPLIAQLEARGYPVRRVSVDLEPELAARHRVGPIPCFVMLVQGREVDRVVGATSLDRLEAMVRRADRETLSGGDPVEPRGDPRCSAPPSTPVRQENRAIVGKDPASQVAEATPRTDGLTPKHLLRSVTVRLETADAGGKTYGSGTVVDRRGGKALIVTCGHIFRDIQRGQSLRVTFFDGPAPRETAGRVLMHDLDRDVGLVVAENVGPGPTAAIAPSGDHGRQGDAVLAAGCDMGGEPSVHSSRVAAVNKFLGPANIVVTGQPVLGRSGGGLFTLDGRLIGVCNAADPQDQEGLYAASSLIHELLAMAKLSPLVSPSNTLPANAPSNPLVEAPAHGGAELVRVGAGGSAPRGVPAVASASAGTIDRSADAVTAAMDSTEVICIIRPRNGSLAESKVLVLDNASDDLLHRIAAEGRGQSRPQWTALSAASTSDPPLPPYRELGNAPPSREGLWRPHCP